MNAIKSIRKNLRLRQVHVARAVGVSEAQVSRFETGRAVPSPEIVQRLAEALGCTTADLGFPLEGASHAKRAVNS